jgi:hypothetical protein
LETSSPLRNGVAGLQGFARAVPDEFGAAYEKMADEFVRRFSKAIAQRLGKRATAASGSYRAHSVVRDEQVPLVGRPEGIRSTERQTNSSYGFP